MPPEPLICLVDDDEAVLDSLGVLLDAEGFTVQGYAGAQRLLDAVPDDARCIVSDIRMPEIDGLELLRRLKERVPDLPVIMMTAHGDVPMAVRAMQLGAVDFIEKPFDPERLISSIQSALVHAPLAANRADRAELRSRLDSLTGREREVFLELLRGQSNKEIARALQISPRTVEIHRARVMEKMAAASLADLVRGAIALGVDPAF
ncbi:MAG: response regulator [Geminicoccaceae bacterium]|nr:response regulator [Geminicoccaceae bacterium]